MFSLPWDAGLTQKTELISVRIPAGVDTGSKVRIAKKGKRWQEGEGRRRSVHHHRG